MSVRAIIADDEPLARERVHSFLADEADVEIIAECSRLPAQTIHGGTVQNSGSAGTRPIGKERPARALLADRRIGESCPYSNSGWRQNSRAISGTYCVSQAGRNRSHRSRRQLRDSPRGQGTAHCARDHSSHGSTPYSCWFHAHQPLAHCEPCSNSRSSAGWAKPIFGFTEERNAPGHDLQPERVAVAAR